MNDTDQFRRVQTIMARLRAPDGCPWDREQTLESLKSYLLEETYEVLDAIERADVNAHREELADLLFQIVFQTQIRSEQDEFDLEDVARHLSDKLVRRHPHVFEDGPRLSREEVRANWDRIKEAERGAKKEDPSALAGIPASMPALLRADRMGKKAAAVGFDWADASGPRSKIEEELQELEQAVSHESPEAVQHELGDLLLAVCSLARHLGVEPEEALQQANSRFEVRFRRVESLAAEAGERVRDSTPERLDTLWEQAKAQLSEI